MTLRDLWVTFDGEGATDLMTINKFLDAHGDYPIIEGAVLAVDEATLCNAAAEAFLAAKARGNNGSGVQAAVRAILSHLKPPDQVLDVDREELVHAGRSADETYFCTTEVKGRSAQAHMEAVTDAILSKLSEHVREVEDEYVVGPRQRLDSGFLPGDSYFTLKPKEPPCESR